MAFGENPCPPEGPFQLNVEPAVYSVSTGMQDIQVVQEYDFLDHPSKSFGFQNRFEDGLSNPKWGLTRFSNSVSNSLFAHGKPFEICLGPRIRSE